MKKSKLALVAMAGIFCFACEDKPEAKAKPDAAEQNAAEVQKPVEAQKPAEVQKPASLTDPRDNKVYKTVAIGKQIWMAENLNYLYNDDESGNSYVAGTDKYGALYPPYAAQQVCPKGWHLPSQAEWNELINFAGGENAAVALKAKSGWKTNGTDEFGFSALPGGFKRWNIGDGDYSEIATKDVGVAGNWWSSTKVGNDKFYDFHIDDKPGVRSDKDGCKGNSSDYGDCYLLSVRCVKN